MEIVVGLSLKSLKPRVWDSKSEYFLPSLKAVMVSYADFHQSPAQRRKAIEHGLHAHLGIPKSVKIYLDNGAFYFLNHEGRTPKKEYEEFVEKAKPDWWPIPQDFIPTPQMTMNEQRQCFARTMRVNHAYEHDGFVPVIHISQFLEKYTAAIKGNEKLSGKTAIALGGIVPNLLRSSKAISYTEILQSLWHVRKVFADKKIHVFGIGGTSTLHLAALLEMDSVDSSGWRNRAARGLIQLPGSGDRMVANLGSWRGKELSYEEQGLLTLCKCPACRKYGLEGLKANGIQGFCNRASHNLWVLLEENRVIRTHIADGTYADWYETHLDNSVYLPLVRQLLKWSALNFRCPDE